MKGKWTNEFDSGKESLKESFRVKLIRASSALGEGQGGTIGDIKEVLILQIEQGLTGKESSFICVYDLYLFLCYTI